MEDGYLALLVALPGELREGLRSLLLASSGIAAVTTADNLRAAIERDEKDCPHLIVVDLTGNDAGRLSELADLKIKCPQSKYLALAECAAQAARAETAGADIAVLQGYRAAELSATVSKMLEEIAPTD